MKNLIFIMLLTIAYLSNNNLLAQTDKNKGEITPVVTDVHSHPFVKMLEDIELKHIGNKKHWRKSNYPSYEFIRCDIDKNRARLSYKKKGNRLEFYLTYFEKFNGEWHFEFNDIIFLPLNQKDGSKTTLNNALKTRNKTYWLSTDSMSTEK